ncbi:MAG: sulfotransferase family protein [Phenylobacterium sp.]
MPGGLNVFFACGAPKSGTTWLQSVLDAHPEVCCSGEGHFVQRFSLPAAQMINTYNAQLTVEAEKVYEGRPSYQPVDQDEFDDMVRAFILRRMSARASAETRWIGDKTPAYVRQLGRLHHLFPQAKILHMVRDPRDVALSRLGFEARAGRAPRDLAPGAEDHRKVVEASIAWWKDAVTAVDAFSRAHPGLVHEVEYRDLHADPVGVCSGLFRFLGVSTDQVQMERIAAATSFEAMSGRRPGEEDASSFLRKGVPGDWRNGLDPQSVELIHEQCGELMRGRRFAA